MSFDGDLGDGRGAELARLVRQCETPTGIIGLSGSSTPWADISLDKGNMDFDDLKKAVARLI